MALHWKKLKVWQKPHALVLEVYRITTKFPKTETYGLVDQIKRASCSIPSNIVEGQSRNTTKEYLNFLYMARGSLEELRYFLLLSKDLTFLDAEVYGGMEKECEEISLMLNGLIKSLKSK
ncbi:MAG: four helix bundle protein [Deltaproteobacteria bacterium]|nr:four helix bundle protein [Deltaproteobacteria bacterium]